jgi:hypothetical protein
MAGLAQKSALSRLVNGLKREPHDFRPSLEVFPALNVDKLAAEMSLAKLGAERGADEEPATDSVTLDDVESRVVEYVEAEKNAAHGVLLDELRTYKERLMALDFEGRFGTIRQAAPAAVSEFRAEAAQGRDELHSLRRHARVAAAASPSRSASCWCSSSPRFFSMASSWRRETSLGIWVGPWKPSRSPCSTSG